MNAGVASPEGDRPVSALRQRWRRGCWLLAVAAVAASYAFGALLVIEAIYFGLSCDLPWDTYVRGHWPPPPDPGGRVLAVAAGGLAAAAALRVLGGPRSMVWLRWLVGAAVAAGAIAGAFFAVADPVAHILGPEDSYPRWYDYLAVGAYIGPPIMFGVALLFAVPFSIAHAGGLLRRLPAYWIPLWLFFAGAGGIAAEIVARMTLDSSVVSVVFQPMASGTDWLAELVTIAFAALGAVAAGAAAAAVEAIWRPRAPAERRERPESTPARS